MSDPANLVPAGALSGVAVGLSVSDSADLARLGLSPKHCDLAIAEVARALLVAGASLVYGGRLVPTGFTQIVLDEVGRFAEDPDALTVCLAASEHRNLSTDELHRHIDDLPASAEIVCLDEDGSPVDPRERDLAAPIDRPRALSGLRRHVTEVTRARVVVGGQLTGFQGAMPGVVEEALLSLKAGHPLYAAGGFGGAAAAVAAALGHDDLAWAPPGYPAFAENAAEPLAQVAELAAAGLAADGLDAESRRQLAVTHRPADIAALVVLGLARAT
jgi:hypothetical protein